MADGIWPKVREGRGEPELMDLALQVHALFPRSAGMSLPCCIRHLVECTEICARCCFLMLVENCIGVREMPIKVSGFYLEICARFSLYIS